MYQDGGRPPAVLTKEIYLCLVRFFLPFRFFLIVMVPSQAWEHRLCAPQVSSRLDYRILKLTQNDPKVNKTTNKTIANSRIS